MAARKLTPKQAEDALKALKARFEKNAKRHEARHKGLNWGAVEARLTDKPDKHDKLWSLAEMERTGGEPDVVDFDKKTGELIFFDCAPESPAGRRSVCFDHEALESRKEHKPKDSAMGMAADMGVEVLSEKQYRVLQTLGEFDLKTSSWIATPAKIRKLKGALFCDRRYDTVFLYHNGADSYYAARGFRAALKV